MKFKSNYVTISNLYDACCRNMDGMRLSLLMMRGLLQEDAKDGYPS